MKKLVLALCAVLICSSFAVANMLQNPGFEVGPASGATPDNWWKPGAPQDQLGQENWAAETGTNGVAFWAWTAGSAGYMLQDVAVDISTGNVFTFTIRGLAEANYNANNTYLEMEFWDASGSTMYYEASNSIHTAFTGSRDSWNTYTMSVTNTDGRVGMVKPVFGFDGGVDNGTGNQAAFWDNATFLQSVPEPLSATFMILGLAGIYAIRRRKQ